MDLDKLFLNWGPLFCHKFMPSAKYGNSQSKELCTLDMYIVYISSSFVFYCVIGGCYKQYSHDSSSKDFCQDNAFSVLAEQEGYWQCIVYNAAMCYVPNLRAGPLQLLYGSQDYWYACLLGRCWKLPLHWECICSTHWKAHVFTMAIVLTNLISEISSSHDFVIVSYRYWLCNVTKSTFALLTPRYWLCNVTKSTFALLTPNLFCTYLAIAYIC